MFARTVDSPPPDFAERSPLAQHLRDAMRALTKKFTASSAAERALVVEDRVSIGPKKFARSGLLPWPAIPRCHRRRQHWPNP